VIRIRALRIFHAAAPIRAISFRIWGARQTLESRFPDIFRAIPKPADEPAMGQAATETGPGQGAEQRAVLMTAISYERRAADTV
jgi:hypothetical protein